MYKTSAKLNFKAFFLTAGILWAGAFFLTGPAKLLCSGYGDTFLQVMASVYPGYHATGAFGDVIVGTLYALVDGGICGLLFGSLYDLLAGKASNTRAA